MSRALLIRWLLFGLAYFSCAEIGHYLSFPDAPNFATFWPASGLFVGALAQSSKRDWWGYIALAVLANGLSELLRGTTATLTVAFCVANTLEALVGAALLHRIHRRPFRIDGLSDSLWFAGLGALAGTLLGAAVGGSAVTTAYATPLWQSLVVWWAADATGVLAVGPILLTMRSQIEERRACGPKVWLEAAAVGFLIVAASSIAFGPKLGVQRSPPAYPFVVSPFLIWAGLRFGKFGTALGVFLASVVAVWGTTRGYGVFAFVESTLEMKATALQVYVMVVTITPLMFAAVIQQQRAAEDRLKQNLKLLQAVMDGSSDAVFVKDREGRYLLINAAGAAMFGKEVNEVVGEDDLALYDPVTAEGIREHDRQTVSLGQTRMYEATGQANGKPPRYFHTTQGPYRDASGKVVGVVGIARDITEGRLAQQVLKQANDELERRVAERTSDLRQEMIERARAEQRLREQQSQLAHAARLSNLGQMAAELAHEVNQPLSVISNYVRGTQRRLQGGNASLVEIEPMLEIIGKEANRAADVVRRIKSFVRKAPASRTPLDAGAMIREAIALVELELRQRQVQWELQMQHRIPQCAGDPVQLQQVIVNLLLNAADALALLPSGQRRVTVTITERDDFLEFAVSDCGPGILPDDVERVFEAFFSSKPEGLGLGLPISRGIIEGHGGKLWIEREQAVGACFRFTLPVWEDPDGEFVECQPNRVRRG